MLYKDMLDELEVVLGKGQSAEVSKGALSLEKALRPTFEILPQRNGRVDGSGVRYLLHRYFLERHGWSVNGFDPSGQAFDSASPAAVFEQHSNATKDMFEVQLASGGLDLHQVAVMAAVLESLIQIETVERLHAAYRVSGLSKQEGKAKQTEVLQVIDTYMVMYVLSINLKTATEKTVNSAWSTVGKKYPHWNETLKWVHEVRNEVVQTHPEFRNSLGGAAQVLDQIADRYGHWQNQECLQVKNDLVKLEEGDTGRVPLARFYQAALDGNWQFSESRAYLRQLGALDETDINRPSVIILNYVYAASNCVASTKFYAVCCINECEGILGQLEKQLNSPYADPSRIVNLVGQMPSATVDAPRQIDPSLVQRLVNIADKHADQHEGRVPLHGRLFMQWLHHAYPRECSFPQLSGTSSPISPRKWMERTGEKPVADKSTMKWHVEEAARKYPGDSQDLPWVDDEELFVRRPEESTTTEPNTSSVRNLLQGLVLAALSCSMAFAMMTMLNLVANTLAKPVKKFSV